MPPPVLAQSTSPWMACLAFTPSAQHLESQRPGLPRGEDSSLSSRPARPADFRQTQDGVSRFPEM